MKKKVFLTISAMCIVGSSLLLAQTQTKLKIGGLGRSILASDQMNGEATKGDTLTPLKGLGGYTLFDLGTDLSVNENFNANAILRMKNPYGSFWGQDVKFEFRQFYMFGKIGKKLNYELGDINVGVTPFTVHNYDEMYNTYESQIHVQRREILEYENFNFGNLWRLQGLQTKTNWTFEKSIKGIGLNVFAVRTNPTNDASVADRIMPGGRIEVIQSDKLSIAGNYVGLVDLPVSETDVIYKNNVFTGDVKYTMDKDNLLLVLKGETGMSAFKNTQNSIDSTVSLNDFFYTAGASAVYKPMKLKLSLAYRNVGPQFNSPAAQTRRINVGVTPELFPIYQQSTVAREQVLFDRFTQEKIYNRTISPLLGAYLPQYNNINPYGEATPNRSGLSLGLSTDTSLKAFNAEVSVDLLSEIIGEGVPDLRKFMGIRGGFQLNVNKLLSLERLISVNTGVKYENTTRTGLAPVDFTGMIIDAGFAIEVVKQIDLLAGVKMLNAKGNEYLMTRDVFNLPSNYTAFSYDGGESVYSMGARLRFTDFASLSANYNISQLKNNTNTTLDYNLNQLFFNFTVKF